mmetsp:Transcript_15587/g.11349  ORF Transcript_15587/g.11349 Transcript_15587/m.11349 type:complete len:175 (+) Transcript_15587:2-526(+)
MELRVKLLIVVGLASWARGYTTTSDCWSCLNPTDAYTTNKYCSSVEGLSTGYCCNVTSSSDYCASSSYYLCSDLAQSVSMKYYFCPNDVAKCFTTSLYSTDLGYLNNKVIYLRDDSNYTAGTTLDFSANDTCAWRLIPATQFTYGKKIWIRVNTVFNATCSINSGTSIQSAQDE